VKDPNELTKVLLDIASTGMRGHIATEFHVAIEDLCGHCGVLMTPADTKDEDYCNACVKAELCDECGEPKEDLNEPFCMDCNNRITREAFRDERYEP
jgi:hypothetical protein